MLGVPSCYLFIQQCLQETKYSLAPATFSQQMLPAVHKGLASSLIFARKEGRLTKHSVNMRSSSLFIIARQRLEVQSNC